MSPLIFAVDATGEPLRTGQDAMDLIAQTLFSEVVWVAVPVARLAPEFFDLRSGVAGEIVQKFVNYQRGLAILGEVAPYEAASVAFRDWVRESNRGRHIWFVPDLDALENRLAAQ